MILNNTKKRSTDLRQLQVLLVVLLLSGCSDSATRTSNRDTQADTSTGSEGAANARRQQLRNLVQQKLAQTEHQFDVQLPASAWPSLAPVLYRGPDELRPFSSSGLPGQSTKKQPSYVKRRLEAKLELNPLSPDLMLAYGVAQYRCDNFEDAIRTLTYFDLTAADSTRADDGISLAVQAMAHYRLEDACEASDLLAHARQLLKRESLSSDDLSRSFVSEAELLIEKQLPEPIAGVLDQVLREVTGSNTND